MPTPKRSRTKKTAPSLPAGWSKLTKAQKRLLDHPPTPKTWLCRAKSKIEAGTGRCGFVNSGRQRKCVMCGAPKPSKPALLWPLYLAACEKAGIQPKGGAE